MRFVSGHQYIAGPLNQVALYILYIPNFAQNKIAPANSLRKIHVS